MGGPWADRMHFATARSVPNTRQTNWACKQGKKQNNDNNNNGKELNKGEGSGLVRCVLGHADFQSNNIESRRLKQRNAAIIKYLKHLDEL